jgi:hypothetical protein
VKCENCLYFDDREVKEAKERKIVSEDAFKWDGMCVKYSPKEPYNRSSFMFPLVKENYWCGEYKPEECIFIDQAAESMTGFSPMMKGQEDPWAKIDLLEKEILKARREKQACVQQIKVCTEHAARMATEENKEYWNGFNYGLCRALIELGVDQETVSKLIR